MHWMRGANAKSVGLLLYDVSRKAGSKDPVAWQNSGSLQETVRGIAEIVAVV